MSRKQPIPGVDEAALAALAGQFPSGRLRPVEPATQDNAPLVLGDKEIRGLQSVASAASGAAPRKAPGRGLAAAAMTLALLAILIAVTSVMPPPVRAWLTRTLGNSGIVDLVTGNRADIDRRLAAEAQSIEALAGKQGEIAARLEASETVVGSGAATRRLDAVEADLGAISQRLAAAGDSDRTSGARAAAPDARLPCCIAPTRSRAASKRR